MIAPCPSRTRRRGGGVTCNDLVTDVRLESPNPSPFIYKAKLKVKKNRPIHILPISKIVPIHIKFFKFYPVIHFLGEKDIPFIYFWCENDTHSYTRRPKNFTPSSRTSVYTLDLWVYYTIPFDISLFWHVWDISFQLLKLLLWLRTTDEGSVPEMRIWSILLIKSDLKWCIHLGRSLFVYLWWKLPPVLQNQ